MNCPWCNKNSKIYDTRLTEEGQVKRRRHECFGKHKHRFTTYEVYDGDYATIKSFEKIIGMVSDLTKETESQLKAV